MAEQRIIPVVRLANFSDSVVAIALTLLILPLASINLHDYATVSDAISENVSKFLAAFVSFWIISLFWLAHFALFRRINRVDNVLLGLNLCWLLVIAFIPFPTYLLGDLALHTDVGGRQVAVALYIGTDLAGWLLKTGMYAHAYRAGLMTFDSPADERKVRTVRARNLIISCAVAIALVVSTLMPATSLYAIMLLLFAVPIAWLVEWVLGRRRHEGSR